MSITLINSNIKLSLTADCNGMSNESALIICLPPDQLMIVSVCSKVWTVHTAQPSTQTLDLGRLETGSAMSALMFCEDPLLLIQRQSLQRFSSLES